MSRLREAAGLAACGWLLTALVAGAADLRAGPPRASSGEPQAMISWTWSPVVASPGESAGHLAFERACAVCHGTGPAKPGTRALRAKYAGKLPALLERRTDLQPDYVKYIVRHGVSVMPPFRKTELSDAELDSIAAYLARKRNSGS
jgi:(+)-pinoresinol hydroxylase